jgi:hypothetical protein
MRKFIATCCCLIVGLQVLIGVPLVICVVFFAYASAASGPVFVTSAAPPSDYPVYSGGPGPLSPSPYAPQPVTGPPKIAPSPVALPEAPAFPPPLPPAPAPQPWTPEPAEAVVKPAQPLPVPFASPAPTLSLSPAPVLEPASAEINDEPLQPADVAEIVATREKVGNPLEGTLIEAANAQFVQALVRTQSPLVSQEPKEPAEPEEETTGNPAPPTRYEIISEDGSTTHIASEVQPETRPLVETLAQAIKQLYAHADWHEQACSWQRADELRELARSLAREKALIQSLRPLPAIPRGGAYYGEPAAEPEAAAAESE